ncbi:MAG: DegV family protein [Mycoplasmoidaceae bacterium]
MKTKFIIDSSTIVTKENLPPFVEVLPLVIIVNDKGNETPLADIEEINIDDIRKEIDGSKMYKTSQPIIASMYDVIEKDYNKYDRIIVHTISKGISSTLDTIKMVVKEVDKDNKVILLDANKVSYGGWRLNLELFDLIKKDASNEVILKHVEDYKNNHGIFFFLTNIDFLIKGGRLSSFKGFLAKKIGLTVSIFWRNNKLEPLAKDKSIVNLFKKSIEKELGFHNKKIEDIKEVVYNYDKEKDYDRFNSYIEQIKKENPKINFVWDEEYKVPSAIFVHTGSGGIFFDIFFKRK